MVNFGIRSFPQTSAQGLPARFKEGNLNDGWLRDAGIRLPAATGSLLGRLMMTDADAQHSLHLPLAEDEASSRQGRQGPQSPSTLSRWEV